MYHFIICVQPISLYAGPSPAEGLVCEATGLVFHSRSQRCSYHVTGLVRVHIITWNYTEIKEAQHMLWFTKEYIVYSIDHRIGPLPFHHLTNALQWLATIENHWKPIEYMDKSHWQFHLAEKLTYSQTRWGITEEGGMFLASILQKVFNHSTFTLSWLEI